MMRITVSPRFEKSYKSLPKRIKEKAKEQELLFRKNPFAPYLKTHRLTGREKEAWAFSINYFYRIKFIFLTDDEVLFLDVGTHEIYK
jgi:mRNA-degrading endonuclease YafQ of YafQ-DinJ toxin-antitoxin module